MTRNMYDGINSDAAAIKKVIRPGDGIAYYVDGRYAWSAAEIAMFPLTDYFHVTITVLGNPADVADCETGDLTPEGAAAWVRRQRAAGYFRPTVYRSLSVMSDIRNATAELIMGKDWDGWVASYDNNPANVYPGAVAHQYRSEFDMDISTVFDDGWPHRKAPTPSSPVVVTAPRWPAGLELRFGMVGHAVEAMQKAFHDSGVVGERGIGIDGQFGPQTLTAVRNFQGTHGLQEDGIAGIHTRTAMVSAHLLNIDGTAA